MTTAGRPEVDSLVAKLRLTDVYPAGVERWRDQVVQAHAMLVALQSANDRLTQERDNARDFLRYFMAEFEVADLSEEKYDEIERQAHELWDVAMQRDELLRETTVTAYRKLEVGCNERIALLHAVEAERDEARAERDALDKREHDAIWNLGGCECYATGLTKPEEEPNAELARPALYAVQQMARQLAEAQAECERASALLVEWWTTEMDDSHYFNEMMRLPTFGSTMKAALYATAQQSTGEVVTRTEKEERPSPPSPTSKLAQPVAWAHYSPADGTMDGLYDTPCVGAVPLYTHAAPPFVRDQGTNITPAIEALRELVACSALAHDSYNVSREPSISRWANAWAAARAALGADS